ncbi:hypothetical protein K488DRAFT_74941, partial [Vararia minispora EC-137]
WGLWSTGQTDGYAVDFEWGKDAGREVLLEYGRRRIIVDAEGMSVQAGGVEHHALRGGTPGTDWRTARLRGRRNRPEYVSAVECIYGVTVEYAREEDLRRIVMADKAASQGIWVFHGGENDIRILGGLPDSWVFDTATMYAAVQGFGRQDRQIGLGDLCEALHIEVPPYSEHNAGNDAFVTAEAFVRMANKRVTQKLDEFL